MIAQKTQAIPLWNGQFKIPSRFILGQKPGTVSGQTKDMATEEELSRLEILLFLYLAVNRFPRRRPSARPQEAYQKALELAYKAVTLDPSDGGARARLDQVLLYGARNTMRPWPNLRRA